MPIEEGRNDLKVWLTWWSSQASADSDHRCGAAGWTSRNDSSTRVGRATRRQGSQHSEIHLEFIPELRHHRQYGLASRDKHLRQPDSVDVERALHGTQRLSVTGHQHGIHNQCRQWRILLVSKCACEWSLHLCDVRYSPDYWTT